MHLTGYLGKSLLTYVILQRVLEQLLLLLCVAVGHDVGDLFMVACRDDTALLPVQLLASKATT